MGGIDGVLIGCYPTPCFAEGLELKEKRTSFTPSRCQKALRTLWVTYYVEESLKSQNKTILFNQKY